MAQINTPKIFDWSDCIPVDAEQQLLAFLDQRSFEYFNNAREERGQPRITAEEWKKIKCR